MASNGDTEEVFDEEELAEGFAEEIVGEEDIVDDVDEVEDVVDVEGDDVIDVDEGVLVAVAVPEEDDLVDDTDVELALDEVLAETIRRTSTPEDDEEVIGEIDTLVDAAEAILPKQDDEFRCTSCRLLKKTSQLADRTMGLCRDCV
jgi:YbbR domain-containing protein